MFFSELAKKSTTARSVKKHIRVSDRLETFFCSPMEMYQSCDFQLRQSDIKRFNDRDILFSIH